jgi:cysteine-rich repeat protein
VPVRIAIVAISVLALAGAGAVRGATAQPIALSMTKAQPAATTRVGKPAGPNPMLAFLPAGAAPDLEGWRRWMAEAAKAKRAAQPAPDFNKLIVTAESEPNDSRLTANAIGGFGTGAGEDPAASVSGAVGFGSPPSAVGPFAEDDGSITFATNLVVPNGGRIKLSQVLGDGPYGTGGTGSGDFDFFAISAAAGDVITADIDAYVNGSSLDPFLVVWDATGTYVAFNDDSTGLDSFVSFTAPTAGTYYVSVGAYLSPLPANPFDSSSGSGSASEGPYDLTIGLNADDVDYYSVALDAGDVISAAVNGDAFELRLFDPSGVQRIGSQQDAGSIMPGPFPTGNAAFAYVAEVGGTYAVRVGTGGNGGYSLDLHAFRPHLEGQPSGSVQKLFIDFNGATIDPAIFGGPPGPVTLSPLPAFLSGWGLSASDENAVIDAILAVIEEDLSSDMRVLGLNGDFDVTGTPGDFDVEILNSRDDPDPFGQPNVSRLIIGGTIPELGLETIGISESIDVGNFSPGETAVVLLDLLSGPGFDPNSLSQFSLAGGKTMIDLIGVGVGNIAAHEAGHFFANFHTDNFDGSPNIMDQGGNLPNTVGVGADMTLGTSDDADVDFGPAPYVPNEGFTGMEDTLNSVAFDLSTSQTAGACGDGMINVVGEECDDGNTAEGDCCSATCTIPTCALAAKGMLLSKEDAGKEKLIAKFLRGAAMTQAAFGNPVVGSTAYHLCVFRDDDMALVADLQIDRAGDMCGTQPCWKPLGSVGYVYKDSAMSPNGVGLMSLKGGGAGKSKALMKGKGASLPSIAAALQTASSV